LTWAVALTTGQHYRAACDTTLLWCVRHMLLISSKLSVSCDVTSQFWVSWCGYSSCSGRHRVLMYAHLYIRCGRQQLEPLLKGDAVDGNLIGSLIEPLHTCNTSCQRTSVKPIQCETCLKLFTHSQMCVHSFAQITSHFEKHFYDAEDFLRVQPITLMLWMS